MHFCGEMHKNLITPHWVFLMIVLGLMMPPIEKNNPASHEPAGCDVLCDESVLDGSETHEVVGLLAIVHLEHRFAHLDGIGLGLGKLALEVSTVEHLLDL